MIALDLPKRKSIRLHDYNYSQNGAYFITICTKDKQHTLAKIVGQGLCSCRANAETVGQGLCSCRSFECTLTPTGQIVQNEFVKLPERFPMVKLDKYVVMPNHIHAILCIENNIETSPVRQGQQDQSLMRQEQSP